MFDVVIIGATGFTGKWVLAQMQMSGSVIAVAGRSETRLNALQVSWNTLKELVIIIIKVRAFTNCRRD